MSAPTPPDLRDPSLFLNRELSQLEFNARVLEQAKDVSTPLLERVRFLAICSTNLDEFFEIRVRRVEIPSHAGVGTLDEFFEIRVAGLRQQ